MFVVLSVFIVTPHVVALTRRQVSRALGFFIDGGEMEIIYRSKCNFCGCWSIHRAIINDVPITVECTGCSNKSYVSQSIDDFKKVIKQEEKGVRILENFYPELKTLCNPGDSLKAQDLD